MAKEKIRVYLKSFDFQILDQALKQLLETILKTESIENIKGPVSLPTRRRIYCVLRSPHVDKDSREQFEVRQYKKIIDIYPQSQQPLETFLKIQLPPAVSIDVQVYRFSN
jgi:small subunit ribosomal protein S10